MLEYRGWRFYNLPQPMEKQDYEAVLDVVVADLRANPGVRAAYLQGSEWVPGISDIDVVVFLDENARASELRDPRHFSEESRYAFMHGYGVYPFEHLRKMFYLNPYTGGWRKLFGETVRVGGYYDLPEVEEQKLFVAATIFDLLINKLLYFPALLHTRTADVRKALGWLWSITYTLDMLEFVTGAPTAPGYRKSIEDLRTHWFSVEEREALNSTIHLVEKANRIIFEIAIQLGDYISNHPQLTMISEESLGSPVNSLPLVGCRPLLCLMNYKTGIVFSNQKLSSEEYITLYLKDYRGRYQLGKHGSGPQFYLTPLPWALSAILCSYAVEDGVLSNWIRQDLRTNAKQIPLLNSIGLQKRIETLNENLRDFKTNRVAKVPFPYGYMPTQPTLKHAMGRSLLKALSYARVLWLLGNGYV